MVSRFSVPDLGCGVGFRPPHYGHVVSAQPAMDWFELLSENFMVDGGSPLWHLEQVVAHYPVALHGVAMSLGGPRWDPEHRRRLRALVDQAHPHWVSDHLCWSGTPTQSMHELLPLPYTPAMVQRLVDRIHETQDELGVPFAVENVSSYLGFKASTMSEWEFVCQVVERADCGLLLDVNNVFVAAHNLGFSPQAYLDALPMDRVLQIHLAGHSIQDSGLRVDTHDGPVCDEVWALYRAVIARLGPVSTLIEWDGQIPEWSVLAAEAARARAVRAEALAQGGWDV